MMCIIAWQGGCAPTVSRFFVTDHRDGGEAKAYSETFDEAYYRKCADGNVDVVLRRSAPGAGDPGEIITQVIHLRSLWRSIPGTTVAESSQINAAVCYMIELGGSGATFEGTGSLFFDESADGKTLTGSLDYALLKPTRRTGQGPDVFNRAELSGTFTARHDPRRTVRGINQIERTFPAPAGTDGRR
jgi:hypothetical protein